MDQSTEDVAAPPLGGLELGSWDLAVQYGQGWRCIGSRAGPRRVCASGQPWAAIPRPCASLADSEQRQIRAAAVMGKAASDAEAGGPVHQSHRSAAWRSGSEPWLRGVGLGLWPGTASSGPAGPGASVCASVEQPPLW